MTKAKQTKKKTSTQKTPLQVVKNRFGDKATLVADLAGRLERREGESKGDLQSRLSKVSSAKLLNLHRTIEGVEKAGGRAALVAAIYDFRSAKGGKEDTSLKAHLESKGLATLFDEYQIVQKRIRAASK